MWRLFSFLIKTALLFVLPFVLLIRGAIYLHMDKAWLPYACIVGGVVFATAVLFIYLIIIHSRISKNWMSGSTFKRSMWVAAALVLMYSIHALFFLNSQNLKSQALRSEIGDLHPILRLAVSTLTYADKKIIITDASRVPEDYRKMGLPRKSRSLHYKQKDGYAYAIDLRTKGRSEWSNQARILFFKAMGFNTLRHTGTDDHLHVSLPCHYAPGAI